MTTKRWLLALIGTAIASASAAIVLPLALEKEAPFAGALPLSIQSKVLGEKREFFVYLPESYGVDTTVRYPVLYVLDGGYQSFHSAESAKLLARIGVIPPMIVVGIPNISAETRYRDFIPPDMHIGADSTTPVGAADRFLSFLQTELTDRIERDYRTARPRTLAGYSLGGLFVFHSQLVAPAFFDARFALSPSLWRDNELMISRVEQSLANQSKPSGFLYLSLGDQENEKMNAAFKHAVNVLESHAPKSLRWRADFSEGGTHLTNPQLSTPAGLCAMFRIEQSCVGAGIEHVAPRATTIDSSNAAHGSLPRR